MPRVLPLKVLDAPSPREFARRHLGEPCVIRNVPLPWPAFRKWTAERLTGEFGRKVVSVKEVDGRDRRMTLAAFARRAARAGAAPPYLKDLVLHGEPWRKLLRDFSDPPYFKGSLTDAMPRARRPRWTWLYWGGAGSFSPLHVDTMMSSAWNVALRGRKRWTFVLGDPRKLAALQGSVIDSRGRKRRSPLSASRVREALRGAVIRDGIALPGDVVYTPSGVLHQVVNETESIAITRNFVTRLHLDAFLDALDRARAKSASEAA